VAAVTGRQDLAAVLGVALLAKLGPGAHAKGQEEDKHRGTPRRRKPGRARRRGPNLRGWLIENCRDGRWDG